MNSSEEEFVIYVVEDDAGVLKSLCALLKANGFETIPCVSAEYFLEIFSPDKKGIIMLDLRLPGMSGTQLQGHLRDLGLKIPIIVVTAHGDVQTAVQSLRAGAIDFIEKPAETDRMLEAINSAAGLLFDRQPAAISKQIVAERLAKLTDREREVLNHLLVGKLNKEIASELGVSQRTIEGHRSRIREKMQARGIADLIQMIG